jgi:hypothetical protein
MNIIDKKIEEFKDWYGNELPHHDAAVIFFVTLLPRSLKWKT